MSYLAGVSAHVNVISAVSCSWYSWAQQGLWHLGGILPLLGNPEFQAGTTGFHVISPSQGSWKGVEEDRFLLKLDSHQNFTKEREGIIQCLGDKDKKQADPDLVWKKHFLHLRNSWPAPSREPIQKDVKMLSQAPLSTVPCPQERRREWLDK